jgi:hypothetical protein
MDITTLEQVTDENVRNLFYYGRIERKWSVNTFLAYRKTLLVFFRRCIKQTISSWDRMKAMTIEQRLQNIEERNLRVAADKAWETSTIRIGSIMLITYIIACGVLIAIDNDSPFRNAIIPVVGYFLSTQSLPFLKRFFIKRYLTNGTIKNI